MLIQIGFSWAKVHHATDAERQFLREYLMFRTVDYRTGVVEEPLYNNDCFPAGLSKLVLSALQERGITVEVVRRKLPPILKPIPTEGFDWLRPHQQAAMQAVWDGAHRGLIQHATGSGKSHIIASVAEMVTCRVLIVVTSRQLLTEMTDRLNEYGCRAGRFGGGRYETKQRVIVATDDSVPKLGRGLESFGALLSDECFVAGTIVSGRPIESVQVGETVDSWDEVSQRFVERRVVRKFRSLAKNLAVVQFASGKTLVCTPNHPFLTEVGWMSAVNICGHSVLSRQNAHPKERKAVFPVWEHRDDCTHTCSTQGVLCSMPSTAKAEWDRVASVSLHEQTSDAGFSRLCADGHVYNLEVEGTHTYTVDDLVVHNCHGGAAKGYWNAILGCTNAGVRLGLSGTPLDRADKKTLHIVGALGPVIHRYMPDEAARDGMIARAILHMPSFVHKAHNAGDYMSFEKYAYARNHERNLLVARLAAETEAPRIVFVRTEEHLRYLKKYLPDATGASSKIHPETLNLYLKQLGSGVIKTIISTPIFRQGVDIPEIKTVINAAGGKAAIDVIQKIGRGSRRFQKDGSTKDEFHAYDIKDTDCGCHGEVHRSCKWILRHSKDRAAAYARYGYTVLPE